jgi:hypothetical protein
MIRAWHAGAAGLYLVAALWVMHPVLRNPADAYPCWSEMAQSAVGDGDQSYMAWAATRNARTFVTAPARLWDFEVCHPFPRAVALNHHQYANGLESLVPYALTGEPILALNAVTLFMFLASGAAMYALAYHWTGSAPAALLAGLLFAFTPQRLITAHWPGIVGNQWTPLALLFAHRLFERARWRDAAVLAFALAMQILESFYQMVPLAVVGGVYGAYLLVHHRRQVPALLPKLLAVGGVAAAVTAFVLTPYVQVRAAWHTVAGHESLLPSLNEFFFGQIRYPGTVLLGLAAIGLADRLRGRRGDDPRVPYLVAGLVLLALLTTGVTLGGTFVPSPVAYLTRWMPGLDAVRGLQFGIVGLPLAPCLLAAYGMVALTERLRGRTAVVVASVVATVALAEIFVPPYATATFGKRLDAANCRLAPPRAAARLAAEKFGDGAVLDLPAANPPLGFARRGHYVLTAAYHRRPTAACYMSFDSPLSPRIEALGVRLPDRGAAAALYALGFRSVILHEEEYGPRNRQPIVDGLASLATGDPRLVELGLVDGHRLYRLESGIPVTGDLGALVAGARTAPPEPAQRVAPPGARIAFTFRNPGTATYRLPDPIVPAPFVARFTDLRGAVVLEHPLDELLPLALAGGDVETQQIALPVPSAAGTYRVSLAPRGAPETVVAVASIEVGPASSGEPR